MKKASKGAMVSLILGVLILFTACANMGVTSTQGSASKLEEIKKQGK